jgi:hypothetical protein
MIIYMFAIDEPRVKWTFCIRKKSILTIQL